MLGLHVGGVRVLMGRRRGGGVLLGRRRACAELLLRLLGVLRLLLLLVLGIGVLVVDGGLLLLAGDVGRHGSLRVLLHGDCEESVHGHCSETSSLERMSSQLLVVCNGARESDSPPGFSILATVYELFV